MAQKAANQAENREKLKLKTPPEQTQCKLSPLDKQYKVFFLSTTRLAKSSINFVHILSPFGNEHIKHNLREA
jgi:hypothetical protein